MSTKSSAERRSQYPDNPISEFSRSKISGPDLRDDARRAISGARVLCVSLSKDPGDGGISVSTRCVGVPIHGGY